MRREYPPGRRSARPEGCGTGLVRSDSVAAAGAAAAAAAAFGRVVRVGDGEAAAHQPVDIVDLGAFNVLRAERVDQDAHAFELGDAVVGAWLVVQGHAVGWARAAHPAHEDAQG